MQKNPIRSGGIMMQKLIICECPSCGAEFMKSKQAILDSSEVTCPMCEESLCVTDGNKQLEEAEDEIENWRDLG